jgi:hypothetical protein
MWIQKNAKAAAIMLIIAVLTALCNSPLTIKPLEEPETFRYMGMLLRNGYIPYVDAFDHKSPGIYAICAIAGKWGIWGLWGFSLLFAYINMLLIYAVAKRYGISYAITIALFFLFAIKFQHDILGRSCDTRDITANGLMLLINLLLLYPKRHMVIKGMLATIIPFVQQTDFLSSASVMGIYILWLVAQDKRNIWFHVVKLILGAGIVVGLFMLYFAHHNAINQAWYCMFTFNLNVFIVKNKSIATHIQSSVQMLKTSGLLLPFVFLISINMLLLVCNISFIKKYKHSYVLVWLLVTAGFLSIAASGNYWHYYIHHLSVCITLLFALALWLMQHGNIGLPKRAILFFIIPAMLLIAVKRANIIEMQKTIFKTHKAAYKQAYPTWHSYMKPLQYTADSLMIFNNPQALCVASDYNIKCASKWVLTHFWSTFYDYTTFDTSNTIFRNEYIKVLHTKRTPYIVAYTRPQQQAWDIPIIRASTIKILDSFLQARYTPIDKDATQGWVLYKRK